MNDMPQTALAVIPASQLPTILAADTDDILGKLAAEINGFRGDVTTEKGRKEIASKAYKVATAKEDLKRVAAKLKEDSQKTIKSINAEVAVVEERMNALRDHVRALLDEFHEREKARIADHEAAIAEIVGWGAIDPAWTSEQIAARITELNAHPHRDRDWQEFREKAQDAARASFNALKVARMEAGEREKAEAEAARIAAEEAEAKRLADEQAQRERDERIAAEAAQRAKDEAERVAAEQAAEAERRAQAEREAAALREQEAKAALERKEQERLAAEAKFKAAAEQAERDRIAAAHRAERDREAAVEAERRRQEQEAERQKEETRKREANVAHRRKVNREALTAVMIAMSDEHSGTPEEAEKIGAAIVIAVAKGEIPHVQIIY